MSNELSHYGVRGMRRGVRKAEPVGAGRPAARPRPGAVAKGNAMIDRYGNKNRAYAVIAGRRVAVAMLSVGADKIAASVAKKSPATGVGISAAGNILNVGMFVKDIADAARVHAAVKAQQNAQGAKR